MVVFNGKELRLTTKKLLLLERKLGRNPIDIFFDMDAGRLPKLGDIMTVLQCAMDGVTDAAVVRLYEDWQAEGHTFIDIVPTLTDLFIDAGLISGGEDNDPN